MPRKPRLYVPGALYHILSRGNNRQNIFLSDHDYQKFLKVLEQIKNQRPFFLYAYCLMPNHFHLLLEVSQCPPSVILQRLLTSYTLYFNKIHQKNGHLFQGRYKAILCDKDAYFLELVRYIHLNPVRTGLVRMPSEWKWSGHREYLDLDKRGLIDQNAVLNYFGEEGELTFSRYAAFVNEGIALGHKKELYPREKESYLGDHKFASVLAREMERIRHKSEEKRDKQDIAGLEEILEKISQSEKLSPDLIRSSSRLRKVAEVRKIFIGEAARAGYRISDIARFLNFSDGYISRMVNLEVEEISQISKA